jgi:hypothetical protein
LFGEIFLTQNATYKVVLKTSADVTVWTADPVAGGTTSLDLTGLVNAAAITNTTSEQQAITNKIQFLAAGAGAVTRSVRSKLRDNVSATDFGAVGDGVTNDRAALVAGVAGGTGLILPEGTYRVSSSMTFSVPVEFRPGAKLSIDAGQTVTFSKGIIAHEYSQLFMGSGTVAGLRFARPEWWGAVRDGTADDSVPLQAALDCVGVAGGGEVRLLSGDYGITTGVTIGHNYVRLCSPLWRATRLINPSQTSTTIIVSAGVERYSITDLSIIHTYTTVSGSQKTTNGAAIDAEDATYGTIERVDLHGAYRGLILGNSVGTRVQKLEIDQFAQDGILINGEMNDVWIRDGLISGAFNGVADTANTGIRILNKAEALMFEGFDVILCGYPLQTSGGGATSITALAFSRFSEMFFDSCTNGAVIDGCRGVVFDNCWFSNRPAGGCTVTNSLDITFTACSFTNNDQAGCTVAATSRFTRFIGCTFDSNGQASVGTYSGLIVAANTNDFTVQGCYAGNAGRFPASQNRGIEVQVGTSDRYIIADNLIAANLTAGVTDGGTGVNKRVSSNY